MSRILVTEKIAQAGLAALGDAGHEVDLQLDLSPEELVGALPGAHGLIIRSATQVTAAVLEAGADLLVVGRAGVGLDNVDVAAATARGVMVVNAPLSNSVSAAEHTMALLLSQARNVPQAHAALVEGRWERSKWEGVELADKVLGIVGLGRIGKLVAARAAAFGMRLVAYDPFVADDAARRLGIELIELDQLITQADFLTLHLAKTQETIGLVGKELLSRAKPSLRVINVARGGIVDETALAEAVREGRVAGAAIDVFDTEPSTDSPLFGVPGIVVTPHLGASTREAQDKAGITIAEQVLLSLAGDFVPFAVNVDAGEASETIRPFLPLVEQLGALFAALVGGLPDTIDIEFRGEIGGVDTSLAVLSALKGLLGQLTDGPVSYVNAAGLAEERGVEIRTIMAPAALDHVNVVTLRGGEHTLGGTISALDGKPRVIELDNHRLEVRPSRDLLVIRNTDEPGMVGLVGSVLGNAGVNINNMHIGESADGVAALMVMATDDVVPDRVVSELGSHSNISFVRAIHLG